MIDNKSLELSIEATAKDHLLPVPILIGLAYAESSFEYDATRYEVNYKYLVDAETLKPFRKLQEAEIAVENPPKDFKGIEGVTSAKEEWVGQKTSFGPLQIMGAVAREAGFKGKFSELGGTTGVQYGIKHFANFYTRFYEKHGIKGVISAYNCGQPKPETNPKYVEKVLHYAELYRNWVGK